MRRLRLATWALKSKIMVLFAHTSRRVLCDLLPNSPDVIVHPATHPPHLPPRSQGSAHFLPQEPSASTITATLREPQAVHEAVNGLATPPNSHSASCALYGLKSRPRFRQYHRDSPLRPRLSNSLFASQIPHFGEKKENHAKPAERGDCAKDTTDTARRGRDSELCKASHKIRHALLRNLNAKAKVSKRQSQCNSTEIITKTPLCLERLH
jgi:hypothetical protein